MGSPRRAAALAAALLVLSPAVFAERDGPMPSPTPAVPEAPVQPTGPAMPVVRQLRYDTSTERVVKGTVEALTDLPIATGAVRELAVRTDPSAPPVVVRMGAVRLLRLRKVEVEAGDTIEITGSVVRDGAREVVLTRLVTVRGRTVALRRPNGRLIRDLESDVERRPAPRASASPR